MKDLTESPYGACPACGNAREECTCAECQYCGETPCQCGTGEECPECGGPGTNTHDPGCPLHPNNELAEVDDFNSDDDVPPCPQCGGLLSGTPNMLKCLPPPPNVTADDWADESGPYAGLKPGGCNWSGSLEDASRGTKLPEGFGFDKYMDRILISEGQGRPKVMPEDNPQRRRAAKHQDRPGNKTRIGGR